jgi:hypothetical protein
LGTVTAVTSSAHPFIRPAINNSGIVAAGAYSLASGGDVIVVRGGTSGDIGYSDSSLRPFGISLVSRAVRPQKVIQISESGVVYFLGDKPDPECEFTSLRRSLYRTHTPGDDPALGFVPIFESCWEDDAQSLEPR